jgi:hypothetical protein
MLLRLRVHTLLMVAVGIAVASCGRPNRDHDNADWETVLDPQRVEVIHLVDVDGGTNESLLVELKEGDERLAEVTRLMNNARRHGPVDPKAPHLHDGIRMVFYRAGKRVNVVVKLYSIEVGDQHYGFEDNLAMYRIFEEEIVASEQRRSRS